MQVSSVIRMLLPALQQPAGALRPIRKPASGWGWQADAPTLAIARKIAPIAILSFLVAWPGGADPLRRAKDLYDAGDFLTASQISGETETPEGYTLAAASLAAHARFNASPPNARLLLEHALEMAEMAVGQDGDNPDTLVQYARVMGWYAEIIETGRVASEGYGSRIKETLDTARRLDPANPTVELLLATWHMEIVTRGGFLGALAFGASRKMALHHYREAANLDPQSVNVLYEYGRGLLNLDKVHYLADATRLLKVALSLPAKTAFDRKTQERARLLLDRL